MKKEVKRVYLYTSKTNSDFLTAQARKLGISKSMYLDACVTFARKKKFTFVESSTPQKITFTEGC